MPAPISSIVVGVDGSPASIEALRRAVTAARRFGASVDAVTTWSYPWVAAVPAPVGAPVPPAESMETAAREVLERTIAEVDTDGVEVSRSVLEGEAGATLVAAAADADLLVVGSRGHGAFRGALLGSVSSRCVAHSTAPVLVVPAGATSGAEPERITVGVDGSDDAAAALDWAIGWARGGTDVVEAVHVMNYPDARDLDVALDRAEREAEIARGQLAEMLDAAEAAAEAAGVTLTAEFVPGDPRDVLGDRGFAADLLVVGGRGRGPVASLLLGSVASYLVHHLDGPLVVVPAGRPTPDGD